VVLAKGQLWGVVPVDALKYPNCCQQTSLYTLPWYTSCTLGNIPRYDRAIGDPTRISYVPPVGPVSGIYPQILWINVGEWADLHTVDTNPGYDVAAGAIDNNNVARDNSLATMSGGSYVGSADANEFIGQTCGVMRRKLP